MFKKNPAYRLIFLIFIILVLIADSVLNFIQYQETKEGMKLTGGILFSLMTIFFADELYRFIKNKKRIKEGT